jgi:hypothetical protein
MSGIGAGDEDRFHIDDRRAIKHLDRADMQPESSHVAHRDSMEPQWVRPVLETPTCS